MRHLSLQEGQGLVEYGLIIVLVAIVVISVLSLLGPVIGNIFSQVVTALEDPNSVSSTSGGNSGGASFGSVWLFVMLVVMTSTYLTAGEPKPETQTAS